MNPSNIVAARSSERRAVVTYSYPSFLWSRLYRVCHVCSGARARAQSSETIAFPLHYRSIARSRYCVSQSYDRQCVSCR